MFVFVVTITYYHSCGVNTYKDVSIVAVLDSKYAAQKYIEVYACKTGINEDKFDIYEEILIK